ncbi:peptidoglycan D,D-transpeptidase FtsI family protein [Hydrogenophaga pseudoflava]|jgi:cell division protein FtsI (penicillin-binding protein 3)|uniref:Peptidoglycan D,D-transpeptidase FtsI n=1 Tax=Hydrogenophaga pseudoflava TaxID=47421 RepID=A0A4P6X015_HYDPS|nr:penicillin-binding protein 2 [Hydrogenophaga pseudoflava]QBM26834.1 Penicillin-binding protein 2 [Hydrogenophaga pseudoflava]
MSKSGHRAINYSASPLLASKTPVWRSKFVVALLALAFAGLGARAAYVQVFGNEFFQRQGEVRFARTLELPANRGRVLDRNGLILASSVVAQSIWAIPEDVDKSEPKLKDLAKLLEMPLSALRKKLANEDKTFVWIKRQVDEPIAKEIAALGIKGIYQRREYKRQYPEGEAAAHVVGFTNVEDRGQEGVELAFNSQLAGKAGSRRVIKDRLGRVIEDVRDVIPPVDGPDLQLSIDSKVQFFAYEKLREAVKENKAKAGSVIVLDAQTGEVLALANFPSYNPNKRVNLSGEQLRNRVLTDSFEPGSTMKPFIAALALEKGLVRPTTQIQTAPGRVTIGGSTISDAHPHEVLTVNEIIQKSSNVGTVKMAMQMHPREMWETYAQAGFGQKPQVPFPGAVSGRLRPYKTWRPIEQATMSYGYGLSASLFQLAQAYTIFARNGELIPVSMLKTEGPATGVRVFSEKNAVAVRKMLELATGPGGTAPKAQTMGYSVGGKTGTAHKQEGKGYAANKYRSWFVGIAPIEQPRIVVAVMIDEPSNGVYFGGLVAAPVFSETVQQTLRILGVQPDMNVKPQIVTEVVEESF